jgi:hypothetical protein
MNIELTRDELAEIIDAYMLRGDESYSIHVAWIIWEKLIQMGLIKEGDRL